MRNLFITASKIIGLYLFAHAAKTLPEMFMRGYASFGFFTLTLLSTVFLLVLACLLVFKSGWVAGKAGVVEQTESPAVNRGDLLAAGLKLIGLCFAGMLFFHILATLAFALWKMFSTKQEIVISNGLNLFSTVVTLILAMLFIFKTNIMVDMLTRAESASWRKVALATLAVIAVLLAINVASVIHQIRHPSSGWGDIGVIGGVDSPTAIWMTGDGPIVNHMDAFPNVTNLVDRLDLLREHP